jgi:hypothetical protein
MTNTIIEELEAVFIVVEDLTKDKALVISNPNSPFFKH